MAHIVIIGGGIIGCTTAYYLSRHPTYSSSTSITVLEASAEGVAQGASGKAGGLVAKWAYPRDLVNISFAEHVNLANEHNGKDRWGWRYVHCGSWEGEGEDLTQRVGGGRGQSLEKTAGLDTTNAISGHPEDLNWVKKHLTKSYSPMSAPDGTAQVHPYLFTTSMMDLAVERGATLLRGCATRIECDGGRVIGVRYDDPENTGKVLPATHVVLCAGAWSSSIVPSLPITATRAHSVTVRPSAGVTIAPYVLFTEIALPGGQVVSPEVYARPDNEIYACGPGDDAPLPVHVDDVEVDEGACQRVWEHVASISTEFREATVEKCQACFLPTVRGGDGPIVGEVATGLFVAAGHSCWGICNGPGTAKVVSELVMGRGNFFPCGANVCCVAANSLQVYTPCSRSLHLVLYFLALAHTPHLGTTLSSTSDEALSFTSHSVPRIAARRPSRVSSLLLFCLLSLKQQSILCRRMNVEKKTLHPGASIPSTFDLRVLKEAHAPSHILAVFDIPPSDWEPSYSPILVPIRADALLRDFRTNIIPHRPSGYPMPSLSTHSGNQFVTLPVVPLHVPHAPSIPLLFLFALGLESRSHLLYCSLLPSDVISEFPALPTMAQLMTQLCSDRQLTDYVVFNQGLWKNILFLGPRDTGFVGIARTAWNVTVEARRIRQRAAAAGASTDIGSTRSSPVPKT